MADANNNQFSDDLEYTYILYPPPPPPPLLPPCFLSYPPRSSTPLDIPREYRPVFPVLRDLSDDELLNLTDLVLFERQRQHVETLREKVRYVDRLTSFLEREGKFGVGDIFTEELRANDTDEEAEVPEASKESNYKGKGKAKEINEPETGLRSSSSSSHSLLSHYISSELPPPLPSSYGVFPTPPPSIVSFYQPLYTPHQAGGAKYSLQALNDPMNQICGPRHSYKQSSKTSKGKGKEKANRDNKQRNKNSDPEIEKRWVTYCQSRFRYQWEMAQADSEILVLEAAVEAVLQRKRGEITGGGGLRRETLSEVNRLRNLRMGKKTRKGGPSHTQTLPEPSAAKVEGTITKLPTELLHQIFSYFRPAHLASSHALVCRRWNYIATPIIYRKIPFGDYMEDYWVEVGRRKRLWRKKQEKKVKTLGAENPYDIPKIYEPLYAHGHRATRPPSAAWTMRYGHGLRHDCHSEQEEDDDAGYNDEEDFYPDGKQGGSFPIGGPALVVMPWSMGIIRAICNPHLAKHVRHIDYQASSYTSFPNHNEAGKVFSDLTDTRPMLDQRFRTLEKLVQLVRKAARQCTRVEVLKLNSGDERIANALLGLLKWSPKLESLSIINTNLRLLQFSRGLGKCEDGLIVRGDGKAKGEESLRDFVARATDEQLNLRLLDSQNYPPEPQRLGLKIRIQAKGPPKDNFYLPSLKRILFFRCGYHPQPQKDLASMEPPVRIPAPRPTDRVQASRDRERRRRRRFRFRAKITRGETRSLEKVVLFLQRCNNLEELKVKGCQFFPEALVDSSIIWEETGDGTGSVEEYPLTLNKLTNVTIRSCGTYLHDRTPEIWLSSAPFERFFLRHKEIKHLGWNGWILNRHLPLEDPVFSRVATHLGRTVTSLSIAHGYDEEVSRTAPDSLHRVRLSLKRFNLLLRHLKQLETLEWRMFHLPVGKMMMGIRNLRRCPKMKNLRIEGVIGVISQDEAREIVTHVPLLEKLRIRWRPRPVGYRRGRAAPGMGPLPPIWGDEPFPEYESSPSPPQIPPSPDHNNYAVPPPPPPALMDSDFEDSDWGGESRREPEWVAAEEVARIFADAKYLKELYVNILISMPSSIEKHIVSMDLRIADEILRPSKRDLSGSSGPGIAYQLRKGWLEKIRETAVAFARNPPCSVRKIGMGYFVGVQGLSSVVTLDRNLENEVIGWSADLKGGRQVGERWGEGVEAGLASSGESWMEGAFKEVEERDWSETRSWTKPRMPTRPFRR